MMATVASTTHGQFRGTVPHWKFPIDDRHLNWFYYHDGSVYASRSNLSRISADYNADLYC